MGGTSQVVEVTEDEDGAVGGANDANGQLVVLGKHFREKWWVQSGVEANFLKMAGRQGTGGGRGPCAEDKYVAGDGGWVF